MNVSKYVAIFFFVFIQLISVGKVFANADEWMTTFRENIAQTWQQPEHYDLYIPAITWHARFAYDKEKTDRYNERPWGGGFGQSRWDEKGNWHGLYAVWPRDVSDDLHSGYLQQWQCVLCLDALSVLRQMKF